jgi:O-antigen ligase
MTKGLSLQAQFWVWATVILTPILAIAGGLGFQLAGLLMGLSAILVWASDRSGHGYLKAIWPFALILFLLWAWVSMFWSPYDGAFWGGNAALLFGLVVPLLFVPIIFLRRPARDGRLLVGAIIAMGLVGVLILLIDSASGFALSLWGDPLDPGQELGRRLGDAEMNLGRGQISYSQLIWPVSALMIVTVKRGWILVVLGILGLAASAYFNNLSIVILGLLLAGAFALLAWRNPYAGLFLAAVLAAASIIFAPLMGFIGGSIDPEMMRDLPLSWEHRVRMWSYSWELIQQAPLIGHGFDSSREFNALTFRAPDGRDIVVMSLHPHNIGLQIWVETGLIGVILCVSFLVTLFKHVLITCKNPLQAFAAAGLIVATATNGAATIGVWQHWWWALIVFAASLICLLPHKKQSGPNPTEK